MQNAINDMVIYYWRYGYSPMTIAALVSEPGHKPVTIADVQKIGYAFEESRKAQ